MKKNLLSIILFLTTTSLIHSADNLNLPVHYDTLKNGLRIIMVPDTNVAVVSCRLYYFVGSMYESAGHTGLSHMYEHMMFKGTKKLGTTNYAAEVPLMASIDSLDALAYIREQTMGDQDSLVLYFRNQIASILDKQRKYIKKDELWELYQNNGATNLNAWTGDDMTAYIVTLPKNKIELFYWIESDRMTNPVLREFTSERDVVMEERRMRYDNKPVNEYWERLNALFYVAHPYRNPTIGWAPDIKGYSSKKLKEHVNHYYTPDNACLILVGNIDPKKASTQINRYFGRIPRATEAKQEVVTREPAPIGETRFTVYSDASPRMDIIFQTPGYPHNDLYRLEILEGIFNGRSGRLYRRLVDKEGLCTNVGAGNDIKLQNSSFYLWAELKNSADPAKVEKIIKEEIASAAKEPPTPLEMQRITNTIRMDFVSNLKSLEGLSDRLAFFERLQSWKDILDYPEKIALVKSSEIPEIVSRYLNPEKMTIGALLPKKVSTSSTMPAAQPAKTAY